MSKVLTIENLHVSIDGKEILKGVDLTIRQGGSGACGSWVLTDRERAPSAMP